MYSITFVLAKDREVFVVVLVGDDFRGLVSFAGTVVGGGRELRLVSVHYLSLLVHGP